MDALTLYRRYRREEIIALFVASGSPRTLCDGNWVIFPHAVLCFTTVGTGANMSRFDNGSKFRWVADKPYDVRSDRDVRFLPDEVVAGRKEQPPIHLFVRSQASEPYCYIGDLGPSLIQVLPGHGGYGDAQFDLSPTLPNHVWSALGGFMPGSMDHASVDRALARLREPTTVYDRIAVLRTLVQYWHGSINPEDGWSDDELDLRIPGVLRWWYSWAGRREKIMSGQNELLPPKRLMFQDDLLVFYGENQWCYEWATLPEGEDPPVFGREGEPSPWQPEGMRVSEHLVLACLLEAIMCHSKYGACVAWLDEAILLEIVDQVSPIAIAPWRWAGETRFYAKDGAFMYSMSNGCDGYSVWLGAKTETPLQFLKPHITSDWDYVAL